MKTIQLSPSFLRRPRSMAEIQARMRAEADDSGQRPFRLWRDALAELAADAEIWYGQGWDPDGGGFRFYWWIPYERDCKGARRQEQAVGYLHIRSEGEWKP